MSEGDEEEEEADIEDPELDLERGTFILEAVGITVVQPRKGPLELRIQGVTVGAGDTIMDAVLAAFAGSRKALAAEHAQDLMLAAVASYDLVDAFETLDALLEAEDEDDGEDDTPPPVGDKESLRFRRE